MSKKKQICKKITIVARGNTEGDFDDAVAEAMNRIRAENTSGGDCNDASGFYFEVDDDVPKKEWPR